MPIQGVASGSGVGSGVASTMMPGIRGGGGSARPSFAGPIVLLAIAGLLASISFFFGGRLVEREQDVIQARFIRYFAKTPEVNEIVRKGTLAKSLTKSLQESLHKIYDIEKVGFAATPGYAGLTSNFYGELQNRLAKSLKTRPALWKNDWEELALNRQRAAGAILPDIPGLMAPLTAFPAVYFTMGFYGLAALLGVIGGVQLFSSMGNISRSQPISPLASPPVAAPKAEPVRMPQPVRGAAMPTPKELSPEPIEQPVSYVPISAAIPTVAAATASATDTLRREYEAQLETLRADRNDARRQLIALRGELETLRNQNQADGESPVYRPTDTRSLAISAVAKKAQQTADASEKRAAEADKRANALAKQVSIAELRAKTAEERAIILEKEAEEHILHLNLLERRLEEAEQRVPTDAPITSAPAGADPEVMEALHSELDRLREMLREAEHRVAVAEDHASGAERERTQIQLALQRLHAEQDEKRYAIPAPEPRSEPVLDESTAIKRPRRTAARPPTRLTEAIGSE